MILHKNASVRRTGATTVEFAFIAILLFSMLFAIFEYGRFLFMHHLAANAARDGARFAAVHTAGGTMAGEPKVVTTADVIEVVRSGIFNGNRYGSGMSGLETQIDGYQCQVYSIPTANLYSDPPNLEPDGKPAWNAAPFHEKIAVRIVGKYRPIVPNLIGMDSEMDFIVTVLVSSEAN